MSTRKLPCHLTWLESFAAAVETGSLEGAAQHLGVGRSVVSEHLKALESVLSEDALPLLERAPGKRLRLTPRGEQLYQACQSPLHQLDIKRLRDATSLEPNLRLGLNPTLSVLLLEALSARASAQGIKLEASFGGAHELVRQVQTRQLDLALTFTPLPSHRGVELQVLASLPFVVLAPKDSPLAKAKAGRRFLRVKDLAGQPFVDWLRDDPYGGANADRFRGAEVEVREDARVEGFLQLYPVLRAYGACAIAPDLRALAPFPASIVAWPLREEQPQAVDVIALWPSGGPGSEATAIMKFLTGKLVR